MTPYPSSAAASAVRTDLSGTTRLVILIGKWAVKLPAFHRGWALTLRGLLANMQEASFTCLADEMRLCPVVFSLPGGWLSVQRRCEPLTDCQWSSISGITDRSWHGMHCDFKRPNFGALDGRVVLLDYGS